MRDFQQKRRWRNILESWPVLIFFGIVLLFFAWSVIGFMLKMQVTIENRKIAENKIAELEQKKAKLSFDIDNLKTDEGKEQIFRENFGRGKEGEGLVIVLDDKNAPKDKEQESKGFFSFFKNLFK